VRTDGEALVARYDRGAMRKTLLLSCSCAVLVAGCGGAKKVATTTGASTADRFGCVKVAKPSPGVRRAPKPTSSLDVNKTYDVTMTTNCGAFTIRVDPAEAPQASASFVSLAQRGFYDNTLIHRVVPDLLIQGGDPTGTGQGGPGYLTHDLPSTISDNGDVGMAKTGTQLPGTAGSQFFVVDVADSGLPGAEYALIGTVVSGLNVVDRGIGLLGDPVTDRPTETVVVERATVKITG
jgi:peptidyl-prolyl cis-trans isomerase B (cyclophilin B)